MIRTMDVKLVVRDLELCDRFYQALGMRPLGRRLSSPSGRYAQQQSTLAQGDDPNSPKLVLSHFIDLPPLAPLPDYPGEVWLLLSVSDIDASMRAAEAAGGTVVEPVRDLPGYGLRAAIASDPEGHMVEFLEYRDIGAD